MADLKKLTEAALVAANQKLMKEKDAIRERQLEIQQELSRRAHARWMEGLSPGQIDAIVHGVTAEAKGGGS